MSSAYESCMSEMDAMQRKIMSLTAELEEANNDIQVYRFALGYEVPAQYHKLTDGSMPQCGLCAAKDAQIEQEEKRLAEARESVEIVSRASNAYMVQANRYREALEKIANDKITLSTLPTLSAQIAREALGEK